MTDITQAQRVVNALSGWLSASPGERTVALRETSDGWIAEMTETRRCRGGSALDALSQIASVALAEVDSA